MAVESGNRVVLVYVRRFKDGTVFSTSRHGVAIEHGLLEVQKKDRDGYVPQTFVVGAGQTIPGLGRAVVGISAGKEVTVTVPPKDAYDEFDSDRTRTYDVEMFERMVGETPEADLHTHTEDGFHSDVIVVRDDEAEVDFNHELVGRTLVFDIGIVVVQ